MSGADSELGATSAVQAAAELPLAAAATPVNAAVAEYVATSSAPFRLKGTRVPLTRRWR